MRVPKVLLINPWIADFAAYDLWSKPLGLLYIGKYLYKHGYKINLIDLLDRERWENHNGSKRTDGRGKYTKTIIPKPSIISSIPRRYGLYGAPKEKFIKALEKENSPEAILVTSHMTYWYPGILETVKILRKFFPDQPIILGGIYATLYPEHAKKVISPNYLVTGNGEKKVLNILDKLFGIERDYKNINEDGLLPWYLYPNLKSIPVITSHGCPYNCTYCATKILNPHFFQKNPKLVVDEIIETHRKFGVEHFVFYDDALLTNRDRHIIPILKGIIDSGIKARFHTPNGLFAKEINENLAGLMKAAGFKTIRLSLESTEPELQRASSNKVSTRNFINSLRCFESVGFPLDEIEVYLIMGLPEQSYDQVLNSIKFVADHGAISRLASYSPIPGTSEWKKAKEMGYVNDDMDPLLTNNSLYPCQNKDFPYEKFIELRQISNQLNEGVRSVKRE